jgi:2-keto-4-pentenoate hydratase/2-oxohepta-3-ene-1,7-dioic acid hydratase in catechol pathway
MGVALSKQLCPKVVGTALWRYEEVRPHWDRLVLRSWAVIDDARVAYQEGTVAGIRPPAELVDRYAGTDGLAAGTVMFCGTLAAIGGVRPGSRFEMELEDPVLGRRLRHAYDVDVLPVVS